MIESDKLIQMMFDKLREEKYNVTNQNQELFIELPMFCSVTAHIGNNQLNIKSRFGKIERTKAIVLTALAVIVFIGLSLISIIGPVLLICAIGSIVWNFMRWQKTQRVINIISNTYKESFNT
jgi:hypothetical protein